LPPPLVIFPPIAPPGLVGGFRNGLPCEMVRDGPPVPTHSKPRAIRKITKKSSVPRELIPRGVFITHPSIRRFLFSLSLSKQRAQFFSHNMCVAPRRFFTASLHDVRVSSFSGNKNDSVVSFAALSESKGCAYRFASIHNDSRRPFHFRRHFIYD